MTRSTEPHAHNGSRPRLADCSFDNALAETINGLYKAELIKPRSPWKNVDDVEIATAEWVDWSTTDAYYAQHQPQAVG